MNFPSKATFKDFTQYLPNQGLPEILMCALTESEAAQQTHARQLEGNSYK